MQRVVITGIAPYAPRTQAASPFTVVGGDSNGVLLRIKEETAPALAPQLRQMDHLGRLAVASATAAMQDAALANFRAEDVGIVVGTGYGCIATNADYLTGILEKGPRRGNPIIFQNTVSNAAAGYVSIALGLRGPSATLCSGWVAGLEAIDFGFYEISEGRAKAMLVGSVDEVYPALADGLAARGRITDASSLSEGSCFFVLESLESARARGARIYCEIAGTGQSNANDAATALTKAVRMALREGGCAAAEIDAVVSGANGSSIDATESSALDAALDRRAVPQLSPKKQFGETMATGGALAVALGAMSLQKHADIDGVQPRVMLIPIVGEDGTAAATVLRRLD